MFYLMMSSTLIVQSRNPPFATSWLSLIDQQQEVFYMHHQTGNDSAYIGFLLYQLLSTGWNEKYLNG